MIVLTLTENSIKKNLKVIEKNISYIDLLELRVDLLKKSEIKKLDSFPKLVDLPVILTYRKVEDGGEFSGSDISRAKLFEELQYSGYKYFDLEAGFYPRIKNSDLTIIRSTHNFLQKPDNLEDIIIKANSCGEIPKVAYSVNSFGELLDFYSTMKRLSDYKKIVLAMGEFGLSTRILSKKIGSEFTYSSCNSKLKSLGHIEPNILCDVYNYKNISKRTSIYGIIGNPIYHSKSPELHNSFIKSKNRDAVYVPFLVDDLQSFIKLVEFLDIKGFSVTVPFKKDVVSYLDWKSEGVEHIGACNTVKVHNKKLFGYNTDAFGFINQLNEVVNLKDKKVAVIGAGGAANSIVFALKREGAIVTIFNRTLENAKVLANRNGCKFESLSNIRNFNNFDIVVQTTVAGMGRLKKINPVKDYKFSGKEICYDIVYSPLKTKFLKKAVRSGAKVLYGDRMLKEQALEQFKIFEY